MENTVFVSSLPSCDLCARLENIAKEAHYDGKTIFGPWGHMCEAHFRSHGMGLGTGRGQRLIVRKATEL